uniref:Transposase n=1 Tax=Brugia timori TaxID=42155 RepID=A0A0R3Q7F9_9BILA
LKVSNNDFNSLKYQIHSLLQCHKLLTNKQTKKLSTTVQMH